MDGFALVLFGLPAVVEPALVAVAATAFPEIADASPYGRTGTLVIGLLAATVSAVGVILAWRGISGTPRAATAVLLGVAAGLVGLLAFTLLLGGGMLLIFAILLIHGTFSICVIAREVLRSAPTAEGR
ncbi:hypothetical protein [Actinoplanes sp. L3-i22]|uniref:hypothetical protein n=1 Tax=Actinoplanes sp. L3-i22 TaxID=2836373 RepID=UPI001C770861|nr:hypothetical protein [Actinoplanes sp. L3-i22]BCY08798.1 hypothetical protein L3i22_038860 [Actinoplanes sp. L3-i22]